MAGHGWTNLSRTDKLIMSGQTGNVGMAWTNRSWLDKTVLSGQTVNNLDTG